MEGSWILAGSIVLVSGLAFFASRRPGFLRDHRRNLALTVALASFLVVMVSVRLLLVGLEARSAAVALAALEAIPRWNGVILGAILLILVGSLSFFFTLGVILWTYSTPGPSDAPTEPRRDAF